jgi:hypothetical protein
MVGSNRGKFRVVGWQNLFREGSFQKNVCRTDSGRVRGQARLKEIAEAEAEVRFRGELRKTKFALARAEKTQKDIAVQGVNSLKEQEREARKMEKDLTATHKRQLDEMRGDLERRQEADSQERNDLYRQGRLKSREVVRNLEKTNIELSDVMAKKAELEKAVKRVTSTSQTMQKDGLGWQEKYTNQQDKVKDREDLLTFLERSVVETTRQIAALHKKCGGLEQKLEVRDKEISTHAALSRQVCL